MPSKDDFVNNRWMDARERLRQLDPNFVNDLESTVRLQNLDLDTSEQVFGLFAPVYRSDLATPTWGWRPIQSDYSIVARKPRRPLSTEWHKLLDGCHELIMQVSILHTAAEYLNADSYQGKSHTEIGKSDVYHWRSWFIHAKALAERVVGVIELTIGLYIEGQSKQRELIRNYRDSVHEQVATRVERQRQDFVHANRPRWAKNTTTEGLWEGELAADSTIHRSLEEFVYPKYAEETEARERRFRCIHRRYLQYSRNYSP